MIAQLGHYWQKLDTDGVLQLRNISWRDRLVFEGPPKGSPFWRALHVLQHRVRHGYFNRVDAKVVFVYMKRAVAL
jgi:hypothetical protein